MRKPPTQPMPAAQLKKLLDSRHEREVLEGLRRVVAVSTPPPWRPLPATRYTANQLTLAP